MCLCLMCVCLCACLCTACTYGLAQGFTVCVFVSLFAGECLARSSLALHAGLELDDKLFAKSSN